MLQIAFADRSINKDAPYAYPGVMGGRGMARSRNDGGVLARDGKRGARRRGRLCRCFLRAGGAGPAEGLAFSREHSQKTRAAPERVAAVAEAAFRPPASAKVRP